jgi:hypothetical protein
VAPLTSASATAEDTDDSVIIVEEDYPAVVKPAAKKQPRAAAKAASAPKRQKRKRRSYDRWDGNASGNGGDDDDDEDYDDEAGFHVEHEYVRKEYPKGTIQCKGITKQGTRCRFDNASESEKAQPLRCVLKPQPVAVQLHAQPLRR